MVVGVRRPGGTRRAVADLRHHLEPERLPVEGRRAVGRRARRARRGSDGVQQSWASQPPQSFDDSREHFHEPLDVGRRCSTSPPRSAASDRRRLPSPRARATARASPTSTTIPSARRRRAGRARAGSARLRRRAHRGTTRGAGCRRVSSSTETLDVGHTSRSRWPRRSALAGARPRRSRSTSAARGAESRPTRERSRSRRAGPAPARRRRAAVAHAAPGARATRPRRSVRRTCAPSPNRGRRRARRKSTGT